VRTLTTEVEVVGEDTNHGRKSLISRYHLTQEGWWKHQPRNQPGCRVSAPALAPELLIFYSDGIKYDNALKCGSN